jgi:hypothetical protein
MNLVKPFGRTIYLVIYHYIFVWSYQRANSVFKFTYINRNIITNRLIINLGKYVNIVAYRDVC